MPPPLDEELDDPDDEDEEEDELLLLELPEEPELLLDVLEEPEDELLLELPEELELLLDAPDELDDPLPLSDDPSPPPPQAANHKASNILPATEFRMAIPKFFSGCNATRRPARLTCVTGPRPPATRVMMARQNAVPPWLTFVALFFIHNELPKENQQVLPRTSRLGYTAHQIMT